MSRAEVTDRSDPSPEEPTSGGPTSEGPTSGGASPERPTGRPPRLTWRQRSVVVLRCLLAGATIALAIPPFGWWPLAFLGVAQWDLLLRGQPAGRRARRTWLIVATWLFPMMLWMYDLTPPGYLIACVGYSVFFATLSIAVPANPDNARRIALAGAVTLGELWRWCWPFEGVPLATLAESQAAAPLGQAARLVNAIGVAALVAIGGMAVSAAMKKQRTPAAAFGAIVVVVAALGWVAPRGQVVEGSRPVRVAVVQGGGQQRTPFASNTDDVFSRHVRATELITGPVDLVLWPENVVAVTDGHLPGTAMDRELARLATQLHAPLVVGVTEDETPTSFVNYALVYRADGTTADRYDKARRVPFGEWVPFRSLITSAIGAGGLPRRDAVPGMSPAVVRTDAADLAMMISWEVFFTDRAADGVAHGGEILANPTNGSSYWLTQVQTQQIASSQLRAIETGRWELQAAPTGFSIVVDPSGAIVDCTRIDEARTSTVGLCRTEVGNDATGGMSEMMVLEAVVERRSGDTVALRVGPWPALIGSVGALAAGQLLSRRALRPGYFSRVCSGCSSGSWAWFGRCGEGRAGFGARRSRVVRCGGLAGRVGCVRVAGHA